MIVIIRWLSNNRLTTVPKELTEGLRSTSQEILSFMQLECSLTCPQNSGVYHEDINPIHTLQSYFTIIVPYTPRFSTRNRF